MRDGTAHEFVKQRDGKSHVAMRRAINHTLFDQIGANGPLGIDLHAQFVGDIAGAVWAGPQFRHGAQVLFFSRRQAVKAHPEKIFIEALGNQRAGLRLSRNGVTFDIYMVRKKSTVVQMFVVWNGAPKTAKMNGLVKKAVKKV